MAAACGNSVKDACEHLNELCANQPGFTIKADCSTAEDKYDKASDSDKEKQDVGKIRAFSLEMTF